MATCKAAVAAAPESPSGRAAAELLKKLAKRLPQGSGSAAPSSAPSTLPAPESPAAISACGALKQKILQCVPAKDVSAMALQVSCDDDAPFWTAEASASAKRCADQASCTRAPTS